MAFQNGVRSNATDTCRSRSAPGRLAVSIGFDVDAAICSSRSTSANVPWSVTVDGSTLSFACCCSSVFRSRSTVSRTWGSSSSLAVGSHGRIAGPSSRSDRSAMTRTEREGDASWSISRLTWSRCTPRTESSASVCACIGDGDSAAHGRDAPASKTARMRARPRGARRLSDGLLAGRNTDVSGRQLIPLYGSECTA